MIVKSNLSLVAALAIFGLCACKADIQPETFLLANGVELDLIKGAVLQDSCEYMGETQPKDDVTVCIEFSREIADSDPDPYNWYGAHLKTKGFDWPMPDGCKRRLNLTAVPKEAVEGDDWSSLDAYVAVFSFEETVCVDQ